MNCAAARTWGSFLYAAGQAPVKRRCSRLLRETGLCNVSWVSLDDSNTNVYSFWLYFTTAISTLLSDGEDYLALVRSN